ncbi:YybH family protein [Flavobacterium sp. '19STA2R22 D10 B1']|uniref:YybH family protein n=1 Tax=Flavobacterium aerium TaxID=3037261 RepID=UPI00278C6EEB|nr:nuclear transport factor 2 family protein [Flavobacterium sp. '19STA2R22 D10 B1']
MKKLNKILLITLITLSYINVNAQGVSPDNEAITLQTKKVFEHHMEAFSNGDVEETLKDYTDDSVIISKGINSRGYIKGLAEIRANFNSVYTTFFPPATTNMQVLTVTIIGEMAYVTWTSSTTDFTTDTFVVKNGKITSQTFTANYK